MITALGLLGIGVSIVCLRQGTWLDADPAWLLLGIGMVVTITSLFL